MTDIEVVEKALERLKKLQGELDRTMKRNTEIRYEIHVLSAVTEPCPNSICKSRDRYLSENGYDSVIVCRTCHGEVHAPHLRKPE